MDNENPNSSIKKLRTWWIFSWKWSRNFARTKQWTVTWFDWFIRSINTFFFVFEALNCTVYSSETRGFILLFLNRVQLIVYFYKAKKYIYKQCGTIILLQVQFRYDNPFKTWGIYWSGWWSIAYRKKHCIWLKSGQINFQVFHFSSSDSFILIYWKKSFTRRKKLCHL